MVGKMLIKLDKILSKESPGVVVVQGDTNTTLAGALAASKMGIKLVHVEAGARSFDRKMPEEVNRVIVDSVSDVLFAITEYEKQNLLKEGIPEDKIHTVGNTTPEALKIVEGVLTPERLEKFGLVPAKYVVITLHRPSNVDDKKSLEEIFSLLDFAKQSYLNDYMFIWPIHPRTKNNIQKFKLTAPNYIKVIEPVGYLDMVSLLRYAKMIFTDSGGVLEEAYLLKVPCVTLRDTVELKMTVDSGYNCLVHRDKRLLEQALKHHLYKQKYQWSYPYPKKISRSIVRIILSSLKVSS